MVERVQTNSSKNILMKMFASHVQFELVCMYILFMYKRHYHNNIRSHVLVSHANPQAKVTGI